MQRYFFHVHDGTDYIDLEGCLLEDLQAARHHAVRYFGEMLSDHPTTFWNGEKWSMDVADAAGLILFSLYFLGVDAPALVTEPRA
jgi:hypothetical protein